MPRGLANRTCAVCASQFYAACTVRFCSIKCVLTFNTKRVGNCVEWQAARLHDGYGVFKFRGASFRAHRAAYEVGRGSIPAGMLVCHRCDNPACCNPDHLFLGTDQENSDDKCAKRRQLRGEKNHSKVGEADIHAIRMSPLSTRTLAAQTGLSYSHISKIKRGVKWKHIE